MSFSSDVKEELEKIIPSSRHCQLAELAAVLRFGCRIEPKEDGSIEIMPLTENTPASKKYFTLWKKTFIMNGNVVKTLQAVKILNEDGELSGHTDEVHPLLLKNSCCRRAFLRGAFLCMGSMSDPRKGYHLEFVCDSRMQAMQILQAIGSFEIEARIIRRKKYHVVYLKEGTGIVDLLNVIGAHRSLMQLETLRVEKEVRNSINRKVNCEAANISKTVNAANKQIEDILLIQKKCGFSVLPEGLSQMAQARLEHPDSSLQELGEYLNPPIGKSGVNHRLRKLSEIADRIRK